MEVELFPAQNYFYSFYNASIINKLIYRSGISGIISNINKRLIEKVSSFSPDLVWVFKGMEVLPETLQYIRNQQILLFNYNPDNPFIFSGKGSGNKNLKNSINLYDVHFTYNLEIKDKLSKLGQHTEFLPFGFDLSQPLFDLCRQQVEIDKACFLGNPDKTRAAFIVSLAEKGVFIDIYGHHWEKFVSHPSIKLFPAVYGDEFYKVLRSYRVQLNLMRKHNEHSHNMRSFEVPGVGGIMLAPDTPEHRMFFKDKEEVFLFTSAEECTRLVFFLIGLGKIETNEIRERARARSLKEGYSYKDRSLQVLEVFKKQIP